MQMNTLPRKAVKATLQWIRLPITGLETVTRQRNNKSWPPAVVFEGFEAGAKQLLGSVLRDEQLVDEGRIQRAKVTELRRADELEVKADQKRARADAELRARQTQSAQQRQKTEAQARQREQAIERDKRAADQKAKRELDQKAAAVAKADELRDKRVATTERQARLTRVNQESAALTEQRRAVQATKVAGKRADAVEQKKAQRKNA